MRESSFIFGTIKKNGRVKIKQLTNKLLMYLINFLKKISIVFKNIFQTFIKNKCFCEQKCPIRK